jgi:hypothetical protein
MGVALISRLTLFPVKPGDAEHGEALAGTKTEKAEMFNPKDKK